MNCTGPLVELGHKKDGGSWRAARRRYGRSNGAAGGSPSEASEEAGCDEEQLLLEDEEEVDRREEEESLLEDEEGVDRREEQESLLEAVAVLAEEALLRAEPSEEDTEDESSGLAGGPGETMAVGAFSKGSISPPPRACANPSSCTRGKAALEPFFLRRGSRPNEAL